MILCVKFEQTEEMFFMYLYIIYQSSKTKMQWSILCDSYGRCRSATRRWVFTRES